MIRCNNCMKTFKNEDELTMFLEFPGGVVSLLIPGHNPTTGSEVFRGCPYCKTDGYLMNIN